MNTDFQTEMPLAHEEPPGLSDAPQSLGIAVLLVAAMAVIAGLLTLPATLP